MSALADKLRAARRRTVEVAGVSFTIQRPTDIEFARLTEAEDRFSAILRYIVGWSGVTSLMMYSGGDDMPVEYDPDVCMEWLSDRLDILEPLTTEIISAYRQHVADLAEVKKK